MSLTMRRNWFLIPLCIVVLLVLVYFGDKRIISFNFWEGGVITTNSTDIENTIDLFDTTQVHEIKILMTDEEYKDMIDTYSSTSEKDWYKTDIVIDWVTIYDVWVRLKWNSSLRGLGWNDMGWWPSKSWMDRWKWNKWKWGERMWGFHWNFKWERGGFPWWNFSGDMFSWDMFSWGMPGFPWFPWAFEGWSFGPWMMSWASIDYDSQLPLFVMFNKYVDQTYQWHEMISLRVGWMWSDATLLAEPYSYELYQEAWQPAPDTSYWAVQIDGGTGKLFIISELPEDDYYVSKWFWDDNWVLYKAWNFIDFEYLWEDPTLYSEYFTQKTRVNDYDMSPLIRMLKFVTESSDEEFEEQIDNYIDVESVLSVLAIDDFVWNQDSFGGMWSNYYLYYHLWEKRFYLLTWDQNLALGGMWWGPWGMWWWFPWIGGNSGTWENNNEMQMPNFFGENQESWSWSNSDFPFQWWFPWGDFSWEMPEFPWGDWEKVWKWGFWMNGDNVLKTRLLANEKFKAMYDEIYAKVAAIASWEFTENFFSTWTTALSNYDSSDELVDEKTYTQWLEKLKSTIENKKVSEEK